MVCRRCPLAAAGCSRQKADTFSESGRKDAGQASAEFKKDSAAMHSGLKGLAFSGPECRDHVISGNLSDIVVPEAELS